jgi:hypothetical protein
MAPKYHQLKSGQRVGHWTILATPLQPFDVTDCKINRGPVARVQCDCNRIDYVYVYNLMPRPCDNGKPQSMQCRVCKLESDSVKGKDNFKCKLPTT